MMPYKDRQKVRMEMQIVIDIPESIYKTIKEEEVGNVVYKAIKNGAPLPKGHGNKTKKFKLKKKKTLRDVCVELYGEEFLEKYETINDGRTMLDILSLLNF